MKKSFLIACSLLSLPLYSARDNWCVNDAFAIWTEAAFFRRANGNDHRLIIDEGNGKLNSCGGCNFSSCDSRKLVSEFDYKPGFRVGMGYMTPHSVFEATYLWIREWESSCKKSDPGKIFFSESNPDFTVDFAGADSATAHYHCQFSNSEVNYFRYYTPRREKFFSAAWLVGIRYVYLGEILHLSFQNGGDQSSYKIHAKNHIPAFQAGGIITWNPTRTLSWDLLVKVGMGVDCYNQHTFLGDLNDTEVIRNYHASGISTPFLTEAALTFTYQPLTYFNLHTAYQMIYLNGVATAPDQISKKAHPEHRARAIAWIILHGWTIGTTFSF